MEMTHVQRTGYTAPSAAAATKRESAAEQETTTVNAEQTDTFEQETPTVDAGTYEKTNRLSEETIRQMKDQIYESMKSLVEKTLGVQVAKSMSAGEMAQSLGLGTTPQEAAAAISEDGNWGVNAVATRLMDMAIQLSGGDVSKAEELRAAVQKGFEQVGSLESLPQVCQDTYTETMKRFDYWIANGSMDGYSMGAAEGAAE